MIGGLGDLGLVVMGAVTPIVSVLVGDEADTLNAGKFLFDRGYYVQSVLFPAVPYHAGVLRIQCNANHVDAEIEGLIGAFRGADPGHDAPPALRPGAAPGSAPTGASSPFEVEPPWSASAAGSS